MRLAIIGTGIAGNTAAYCLSQNSTNSITVYEKESRIGGHSATVDIDHGGTKIAVDTGFIVYNELNYPELTGLFGHLGVKTENSDMSFGVSANQGGYEWCGRTHDVLRGLFAQKRNLLSPRHIGMLLEILRFNTVARADYQSGRLIGLTLGDYLTQKKFSAKFRDAYLVPMGASIWSMSPKAMLGFPIYSFVDFCEKHCLLQWDRPVWRTVTGGSRNYVKALTAGFQSRIKLSTAATKIQRFGSEVHVWDDKGMMESFDHVIMACHSDQSLALIDNPCNLERSILGAIRYKDNDVWLHCDPQLMPKRKQAWAAWNVLQDPDPDQAVCLTYWMNVLQNIDKAKPVFVTLNPKTPPRPETVFGRYSYAHPQYDEAAIAAQARIHEIQGIQRIWFCGAWTGYGFHEDGLASGLNVARLLGAKAPWHRDGDRPVHSHADNQTMLTEAAE